MGEVKGPLWIGVALGLGAATGQAIGSIIARPVMETGIDPFVASMLRVGIAAAFLTVMIQLPIPALKPRNPLTWKVAAMTALTGILALAIGMTLLLFALSGGKVGIVSTLSATSPSSSCRCCGCAPASGRQQAPGPAPPWWWPAWG